MRGLTGAAAGLLLLGAGTAGAGPQGPLRVALTPESAQPGTVILVRLSGPVPRGLRLVWGDRALPLFPADGGLAGLAGIDLDAPAGRWAWQLVRPGPAGAAVTVQRGTVTVQARSFATQHLTLPPAQVDLDAETLARVRRERAALDAALSQSAGERLWRGPFRTPVEGGQPTGGFGLRRVINGQPRRPHAGFDWAAPAGTSVVAANVGRVALVAEHFFAGHLVVLDHGLGLFTLYFHLDVTRVGLGERVARGQPIGAVGASGRATGPHLHLAVSLGGARVDPEALLGLALP